MKIPGVNKVITVTLLVVLLAVPLIGACAKPAPAPTPTAVPVPKPASAPATKADPLASIIEGAKKEGW